MFFSSKAQSYKEINQPDYDDERKFHFGLSVGTNRAHYNIVHSTKFLQFDSIHVIESINKTGLNLAWSVDMKLGNHFALRGHPVDLTYTEKAFSYVLTKPDLFRKEDSVTIKKVEGISFALPVQLKFMSDRINNFKVYIIAGARFDYDLAANSGKKNNDEVVTLKKIDFSSELGIGFHFYFPLIVITPELKVTNGFRNVLDKTNSLKYSNVIDKLNARSVTFSLTFE
jgi:Outer membrane protein beta-barrel domain